MKENLRYQMKFFSRMILVLLICQLFFSILSLIFASSPITEDFMLTLYGMSTALTAGLVIGLYVVAAGVTFPLTIAFGNTRCQWFIISAFCKILFSMIVAIGSWFLVFFISQIFLEKALSFKDNEILIAFIILLFFALLGDFIGNLFSRFGLKVFYLVFGAGFITGVIDGLSDAGNGQMTVIESLFAESSFSIPVLLAFCCLLLFVNWRFIRRQEVKI